ncbi:MAG: deoxyribose-phosphate aldolase [Actinomycetes bacterium]|nr:deoxyribose-phosphate aldolase [Actinomycetes bacterium]
MNLAPYIDHTNLSLDATEADIIRLCQEAQRYGFAAVCLRPSCVGLAVERLADTPVAVGTVVDFPHGIASAAQKVAQAQTALGDGAQELDMVLNVPAVIAGDDHTVATDIRLLVEALNDHRRVCPDKPFMLKVILETARLSDEEIVHACHLAVDAGADFVKTSTGTIAGGGATTHAVRLMRATVGPDIGVKAAGGIRDRATAEALIAAGANRLGTSASVAILRQSAPH